MDQSTLQHWTLSNVEEMFSRGLLKGEILKQSPQLLEQLCPEVAEKLLDWDDTNDLIPNFRLYAAIHRAAYPRVKNSHRSLSVSPHDRAVALVVIVDGVSWRKRHRAELSEVPDRFEPDRFEPDRFEPDRFETVGEVYERLPRWKRRIGNLVGTFPIIGGGLLQILLRWWR
jgi:broad specificity phosphatase PhoE